MKITGIETIRITERPNLLWVRVHTDEGLIGLGETFFMAETVEAYIHEFVAPRMIGRDPLQIDLIASDLTGYLGFRSTGAEVRGNSAFDIALWDLFGKAHGQPVCRMLGGRSREAIRVYNTCAGYRYVRDTRGQKVENWGTSGAQGPYEDLDAFLEGEELPAPSDWAWDRLPDGRPMPNIVAIIRRQRAGH